MHSCNRRRFMMQVAIGAGALAVARFGAAEDQKPAGKMTEEDAYGKSMGFRLDTTKVDGAKYPKHTPDQQCSKCQLFSGKEGEAEGPCSFFGGRIVSANGWCRNFKARAA